MLVRRRRAPRAWQPAAVAGDVLCELVMSGVRGRQRWLRALGWGRPPPYGAAYARQQLPRMGPQVPNSNYCAFEDWVMPVLGAMLREQQGGGARWTPSKARLRALPTSACALRSAQWPPCPSAVGAVCTALACLTSPGWLQCWARQSTCPP